MDDEKLKELFGKYGKATGFQEHKLVWIQFDFSCLIYSLVPLFGRACTQYPGYDWWQRQI